MSRNGSPAPERAPRNRPFRPWEHQERPEERAEGIRNAIQQELEGIMQRYRDEAIGKTAAVREISSYIGRACELHGLVYNDDMLEPWLTQLMPTKRLSLMQRIGADRLTAGAHLPMTAGEVRIGEVALGAEEELEPDDAPVLPAFSADVVMVDTVDTDDALLPRATLTLTPIPLIKRLGDTRSAASSTLPLRLGSQPYNPECGPLTCAPCDQKEI